MHIYTWKSRQSMYTDRGLVLVNLAGEGVDLGGDAHLCLKLETGRPIADFGGGGYGEVKGGEGLGVDACLGLRLVAGKVKLLEVTAGNG